MTTVHGRAFEPCSIEQLERYIDELLSVIRSQIPDVESLLVLPTANYPYHPSTGLVTHPDVAVTVAKSLSRVLASAQVSIGITGSSWSTADQVGGFLGYPELLEHSEIDLVHLDDVETRERVTDTGNAERTFEVPKVLEERAVLNVPTLYRSSRIGMMAGMGNLTLGLTTDADSETVIAASSIIDPVLTLLDGTYVYCGTPSRPSFLLSSHDQQALDQVGRALLGLDHDAVPYLGQRSRDPASLLDGIRLESVRSDIRHGHSAIDERGDESDLMARGYRLYARLSGDVLPPKFVKGNHE